MNFLINGSKKLENQPDFKLVGREKDLERFSSILMRDRANSVLLTGPGGVGCSALCLGLQAMKSDSNAPFDIVNKRLFWLDIDGLFSSGNSEEINANFQKICSILRKTPNSILFIEDAKDFIDVSRNYGVSHFINSINAMIKANHTQVVLETRDDDLDVVLKCHSDITEYYTMLDLSEPTNGVLIEIVKDASKHLYKHHGINIDENAMLTAIDVTTKYRTKDMGLSRAQPERSITLLDRALSTYRLNSHKQHPDIPKLLAKLSSATDDEKIQIQSEINKLNTEFAAMQEEIKKFYNLQRDGEEAILAIEEDILNLQRKQEETKNDGSTQEIKKFSQIASFGGFETLEIRELRVKIKQYQSLVNENSTKFNEVTEKINSKLLLTDKSVLEEFSLISGISADKLNEDEMVKLKSLEENILTRIYGQNEAVKKLVDAVKIAKVGKRNKGKPMASFMYLGPSGVGKTEIAKALTQYILDDESALLRFDMSEYMEKHAVSKLIGAPPGYEGFEAGGILTNALRKNPNRIILFDEIEKGHPDVFNLMLQILSDGRLTDNVGRTVSFENTIIIMTTNIGQIHFLNQDLNWEDAKADALKDLDGTYRSEFLNRFNGRQNIICFKPLDLPSIQKIVNREIQSLDMAYKDQGLNVVMDMKDIEVFCEDNYDPTIGARGLPGFIQANLEPMIVNSILDNPNIKGTFKIGYDVKDKKFTFEIV